MKVIEYFEKSQGRTYASFEILPPLKGGSIKSIYDILDPLVEFKPPFIDVTYHREDFEYIQKESGYFEKIAIRKRPGTVGICAAIQQRYGVDAVPHLICGGFTKEDTENALIDLHFLDIHNVLALRGDARRFEGKFIPEKDGNFYALDLVQQITRMNEGKYLDNNIAKGSRTDFCIGIAGYPEKHFEAPNIDNDLKFTKEKIEAGANYIVTQMFFDNQKYYDYVESCRKNNIFIPIVPGIKPITKKSQLISIPRTFFINLPADLVKDLDNAKDDHAVKEIGIRWAVEQAKDLKAHGAPCLHFYTMGDVKTVRKICEQVF